MISYDAMVTEITARLGNRGDIAQRMNSWINYGYLEITKNPRFNFYELDALVLFTTLPQQGQYDLAIIAPNFWFILDLVDLTHRRKFKRSHFQVLDRIQPTFGQPVRYYRFSHFFTLDPTPDDVYDLQLRYRRKPELLATGAGFDSLGDEWEEPIVTLATAKAAQALSLPDIAAAQRALLEPMLQGRLDVPQLEDSDSETGIELGTDMVSITPVF